MYISNFQTDILDFMNFAWKQELEETHAERVFCPTTITYHSHK